MCPSFVDLPNELLFRIARHGSDIPSLLALGQASRALRVRLGSEIDRRVCRILIDTRNILWTDSPAGLSGSMITFEQATHPLCFVVSRGGTAIFRTLRSCAVWPPNIINLCFLLAVVRGHHGLAAQLLEELDALRHVHLVECICLVRFLAHFDGALDTSAIARSSFRAFIEKKAFADQALIERHYFSIILNTAFLLCCKRGDRAMVELLVRNRVETRYEDDEGLCRAVFHGHLDLVEYLLANGANPRAQNGKPMFLACQQGRLVLARVLHHHGAPVDDQHNQNLMAASSRGHYDVVKFLVEHGADVNAQGGFGLRIACSRGHWDIVQLFCDRGVGQDAICRTSLGLGCLNGHLRIVQLLLSLGADLHENRDDPLFMAAHNGHLRIVEYLLMHGADPFARGPSGFAQITDLFTADYYMEGALGKLFEM